MTRKLPKTPRWSDAEDSVFKQNYMLTDGDLVKLFIGRTVSSIKNRRVILGLVKFPEKDNKKWTDSDYKFISENSHLTDYAIAKQLGVSAASLKCARQRIGGSKTYTCRVCSSVLSQQGNFCKEHRHVGRQVNLYSSKSNVRGREFDLTEQEVYDLVRADCTYCGGEGYGIDRIDSSKGYFKGNVTPCCSRCNTMKNDMTVSEFEAHIRRIAAHMGSK